ncbi:MAG: LacI family DNA-binding transcriptional regulator [Promicromonosporaceae bacterium]|nr:LacI family DNA-binding transcriptional regulator [Promicromonosporaceae bacterium]
MSQAAPPKRGGVTIAQIAADAGVSAPTVSKVLNGRPGVSAALRQRIEALLDEQGYVQRRVAPGSGGLVDFVIESIDTAWSTALLGGAQEQAALLGMDLAVTAISHRTEGAASWVDHICRRGSNGVVLVAADLSEASAQEFARRQIPVVLIDPTTCSSASLPVVAGTNWAGALEATDHLVGLGHTRIGFITGPLDSETHCDRLDGYRSALGRHGLPADPELVRGGDSLVKGGFEQGLALLQLPEPPTAIISGSDEQALGIYRAAAKLGVSIPQHLSVVGFDDVALCKWVTPELTTVHQPLHEMGREATRIAVEMGTTGLEPSASTLLSTTLVVRGSTAPPPGK